MELTGYAGERAAARAERAQAAEGPEVDRRQLHLGDRGERPRGRIERGEPLEDLEHRLRVGAVGLRVGDRIAAGSRAPIAAIAA